MKNQFSILLLLLIVGNSFAQKIMERELDASEITSIEITSEVIYHIKITSEKTNQIKIKAKIEGENYENVVLNTLENNEILFLNTSFSPFFESKNDKLAAHKLISIEIELMVPESITIKIKAEIASVETIGKLKSISALLENGNCLLNNFQGSALLKTKQGFIKVFAPKGVFGIADSKKGKVINELDNKHIKKETYRIEAESISGDISLLRFIN